jgi:pimeloyl-ACP methyl ester carboxylesterase
MTSRGCVLLCAAWLVGSLACAAETPKLPTPSGPYGIGRVAYDWIDTSRMDRLSPDPHHPRELMVYLWYPTTHPSSDAHGVYLSGAKQMDADPELGRQMRDGYGDNWPLIVSGAIYSHAVESAPPAKAPEQFPVIIFSHGLGGSSFGYTSLIENLVSHGYVVVAIEHTGTAGVVVFSDGRVVQQHQDYPPAGLSPAERFQRMVAQAGAGIEEGAGDVRFVLNQLTRLNAGARQQFLLASVLDLNRVAAMGHSAGAEFAARACELDARFKACVDLDGAMVPVLALPESGDGAVIQQPLLFLEAFHPESRMGGTHEEHLAFFKKKEEQLAACPRGSYAVVLNPPGMMHGSFSDTYLLGAGGRPAETAIALHNLDLAQSFILAFLDKNLKHASAPLLDDSNANHPEATVRRLGH